LIELKCLVVEKVEHGTEYEEVLDGDNGTMAYNLYIIHDFDYAFTHYEAKE
jgi:hypothetical protein